ncbi:MAG: hypothetical protein EOP93_18725, partial [Lysobacteraceae bacterium]
MNTTTVTPTVAPAVVPATNAARALLLRVLGIASRIAFPIVSILGLWYLAIAFSGLPEFVIPRPTQVLAVLTNETTFVTQHLVVTLRAAAIGFLFANIVGIGLAVLFTSIPIFNRLLMPAAIT